MNIYIVYEMQTGKIIHVHRVTGTALEPKPEDILRLVHSSFDRSKFEVLRVDHGEMIRGTLYQVNTTSKRLEAAPGGAHAVASARHCQSLSAGSSR